MKNRKAPEEKRRRSHGRKVFIGLTLGALLLPYAHASMRNSKPGYLRSAGSQPAALQTVAKKLSSVCSVTSATLKART